MIGITVCVDYSDYLGITLPLNRGYFSEYFVITTSRDSETIKVAKENECTILRMDECFDNNTFDKGRAIDSLLGIYSNLDQWIGIVDADIVIGEFDFDESIMDKDCIFGPHRRQFVPNQVVMVLEGILKRPDSWLAYKTFDDREIAGYCQIFNMSASCLRDKDNFYDWARANGDPLSKHAGGCDSFFNYLYPRDKWKRILSFEVLHLGEPGKNWCGRISSYLDGTEVDREIKNQRQNQMRQRRRKL